MTAVSEKNEDKNLNITLKNEERENGVVVSFPALMRNCKRYLIAWLLFSVILGGIITGISILLSASSANPVTTLVGFTYPGIENGKNPDGTDFESASLKSPVVISAALTECNLGQELVETVRENIIIKPIIPSDAIDRITVYANIYENASSGQLSAAEAMLDVDWYSSQFQLKFDYKDAGLKRDEAADLLNAITISYRNYFIQTYGYNNALGNALKVLDYNQYDYAEAVDMFDSSLSTLRSYVNNLAGDDDVRFRSTVTGYTFADLRSSIDAVRELDLDLISSYISQNNVTKDKDRLEAYYEYRIELLNDDKIVYEQRLASIKESIDSYEKDSIYIFANDVNTQSTTASDQYDKMIAQKISTQTSLSETTQRIDYYNRRLTVLRKNTIGTTDKVAKTEADLANVSEKVNQLVELVELTADDYYQNYSLINAYSVLVPATSAVSQSVVDGIHRAIVPAIGLELLLFVVFLVIVFVAALKEANPANQQAVAEAKAAADDLPEKAEGTSDGDSKTENNKKKK